MVVPDKMNKNDADMKKERYIVIGGGPAGSFFALYLLREARRLHRQVDVVMVERKALVRNEDDSWWSKGCNFGAGGISPRLHAIMEKARFNVPAEIIRGEIERIWIQGRWKNIPIKVPDQMKMYSVFRGSLPFKLEERQKGLDAILLGKAIEAGVRYIQGEATEITFSPDSETPVLTVKQASGEKISIPASFIAVGTGVNAPAGKDYRDVPLILSMKKLNPSFVPARTRKTIVFELRVPHAILEKNLKNEAYFIEYGSKELTLEHISLVPKRDFLTVSAIGEFIDKAVLPRESRAIIKKIVDLPQLKRILPDIADYPVVCTCVPMMTVGVARNPYAERVALIGDAVGSRLYKDGLYSAFLTASQLAHIVMHAGSDKRTLTREYGKTVKWLSRDNRSGKLVFRLIRLTFSNPLLSRILYQTFATELKIKDKNRRPLGQVLWKIASGHSDYRAILREMFSPRALYSVLVGGLFVTLRNISVEFLLGLKWGEYGKYPTVVLKEKRDYVKASLSSAPGISLDKTPDFERLYAIKIKAPAQRIFTELGKFGDEKRNYMRFRFVEVKRTKGSPNERGSVIIYRLRLFPLSVDMRLERVMPEKLLYYELTEEFADRGKLVFEVKPTEDGNNRLVIYASFDFKKGSGVFSKIFWWIFRSFFPAFIHDVVWNHALCSIKEDAELQKG